MTFELCLFYTRFILAGKRIVHYLFVVMSDARSLYDIQRECAQSQEISDWNVFWTLYDDVEQLCVSGNEKPISVIDVSIAIHKKVKLEDRCPFERTDCKMEKRIVGALSSIVQPTEFEIYSIRLLQLIDLYYRHFILSPLLLEQLHHMYITILQWLQKTPESSLQSVLLLFLSHPQDCQKSFSSYLSTIQQTPSLLSPTTLFLVRADSFIGLNVTWMNLLWKGLIRLLVKQTDLLSPAAQNAVLLQFARRLSETDRTLQTELRGGGELRSQSVAKFFCTLLVTYLRQFLHSSFTVLESFPAALEAILSLSNTVWSLLFVHSRRSSTRRRVSSPPSCARFRCSSSRTSSPVSATIAMPLLRFSHAIPRSPSRDSTVC